MPNKNSWFQLYEQGLSAIQQKDWELAKRMFSEAIAQNATRWEIYYARAWASFKKNNFGARETDAELKDLQTALELGGPTAMDAAGLLGHLYQIRGENENAIYYFLMAYGQSSETNLIEHGLIETLSQLLSSLERPHENYDECIQTCDRLEKSIRATDITQYFHKKLLAEVLATRAFCYQQAGDDVHSQKDWLQVASLDPTHPRVPDEVRTSVKNGTSSTNSEAMPTFDSVGGKDEGNTFQSRLCSIFEVYFGDGDPDVVRNKLKEYGQRPTRSILLFGPSGCGKTYMIRSFSGEYRKRFGRDLPIQWVRLNEVQQKYVGESEKAMTKLIDTAIQTQPSILFADEVDAIGMSRENGEDWRVSQTAHMLQEIDRLNQSGAFVLFFGSTNRMWSVDLAMLRRFDELIPVDMPTEAVRQMIFKVHLSHLSARVRAEDLNYDEIGKISHGLTPGDIEKVVRRSVNILLQENGASEPHRKLTEGDIIKSIREYKKPMHLSEWVRQSLQALRSLGQEDMAEQVEEMYGPYVDMRPLNGTTQGVGSVAWEKIPDTAWEEPRRYNIPLIRTSRRLG